RSAQSKKDNALDSSSIAHCWHRSAQTASLGQRKRCQASKDHAFTDSQLLRNLQAHRVRTSVLRTPLVQSFQLYVPECHPSVFLLAPVSACPSWWSSRIVTGRRYQLPAQSIHLGSSD